MHRLTHEYRCMYSNSASELFVMLINVSQRLSIPFQVCGGHVYLVLSWLRSMDYLFGKLPVKGMKLN